MTTTSRQHSRQGSAATRAGSQELASAIHALDLAVAARARVPVRSPEYECARAVVELLNERVMELVRRQNQRFR